MATAKTDGPAVPTQMVEIKSKFELEFRRISVPRSEAERLSLEAFYRLVTDAHCLPPAAHVRISYQSLDKKLVHMESTTELATALRGAAPLLRVFVSRLRGVEVEESGSEEEEFDEMEDKCEGRKGGGRGGGGWGKGGEGRGRVSTATDKQRGSNGRVCGEKTKSVGRGRGRSRQTANVKGADRVKEFSPTTSWGGDCSNSQSDREEQRGNSPGLLEDSRGSAVCGVHSRAVRGGGGREEEDGLPEHPLVTLFKEQEQLGRGTRTTAIRGTEERGENRHVEMENGQDIGTLIDTLSLSNNVDQLSSDGEEHEQRYPFVIEIYGFDPSLKTRDLLREFEGYQRTEFCIKWVNDTHALGIFASERQAWLAAGAVYRRFKTRMVRDGIRESIALAEKLGNELRPQGCGGEGRPKTTAMVARRMVTSALGIRVKVSQEQREKEKRELQDARERRRLNKLKIAGELNCNDSVNARSHFTT